MKAYHYMVFFKVMVVTSILKEHSSNDKLLAIKYYNGCTIFSPGYTNILPYLHLDLWYLIKLW